MQSIGAKVGFVRRGIWSYEFQTLEGLLRDPNTRLRDKQATEIAQAIIKKTSYPEAVTPDEELEFLNAFYIAQREHFETLRLFGKRRENKFHNVSKDTTSPSNLSASLTTQASSERRSHAKNRDTLGIFCGATLPGTFKFVLR
ncbi:hypothetical protein ACSV5G_15695 [Agrobacterium cavarae]|uniref:hypothetical protein n=1 Tax=Agrobacterium cavarae TaxID=2528239 RepID=UPI003FD60CCC